MEHLRNDANGFKYPKGISETTSKMNSFNKS